LSQYIRPTLINTDLQKKTENYQHNANKQLAATIPVTDMDLYYKKRPNT